MKKLPLLVVVTAFLSCGGPKPTTLSNPVAPPKLIEVPAKEAEEMIKNAKGGKLKDIKGAFTKFDESAWGYFRSRSDMRNMAIVLGGVEYEDTTAKKPNWYPTLMLRFEKSRSNQSSAAEYVYFRSDDLCPPPHSGSCDTY